MANEDQLRILRQGAEAWNIWRRENPDEETDLSKAYLRRADLNEANLRKANLHAAILNNADLSDANLTRAILSCTNLNEADLSRANLSTANLNGVNLSRANLKRADLSGAKLEKANLIRADLGRAYLIDTDLSAADLSGASLIETDLIRTILTGCRIYGISAWGLKIENPTQNGLIITPKDDPDITADNLQVAQFIYLLLHNEDIRQVIDTITSKVVLILGRFKSERKAVLDTIRDELRKRNYLPVMFDFDKPASRDLTETISTLAHMSRFIIADITDANAVPVELERIAPDLPSVPIAILIQCSNKEYALFDHIRRYSWVLEPYRYEDQAELISSISERIIVPAERKVEECKPH